MPSIPVSSLLRVGIWWGRRGERRVLADIDVGGSFWALRTPDGHTSRHATGASAREEMKKAEAAITEIVARRTEGPGRWIFKVGGQRWSLWISGGSAIVEPEPEPEGPAPY